MRFAGHDLLAMPPGERRRLCGSQMGMILQDPKYSLNPVMTVAKQMGEAFRLHEPGLRGRALRERIVDALAAVQIRDPARVADAYPHELSGGMGQRVMIAMMVSTGPRLLIADEPTSALDVAVSMQVLAVLDAMIARHDTGLMFISHDLPLVMSFCDRVAVMYAGRVVETCAARDLRDASHPYTRGLLAANPPLANPPDELPVLRRDPAWLGPRRLPARPPIDRRPHDDRRRSRIDPFPDPHGSRRRRARRELRGTRRRGVRKPSANRVPASRRCCAR